MPAPAAKKVTCEGVFRHAVDPNRRVQMPFRWRSAKPLELTMIVWPQHPAGACLRVLSPEETGKLWAQVAAMPTAEKRAVKRFIAGNSVKIALDSAKRLAIPEEMAAKAGITDQVVFAGMNEYFEIWNPARHEAMNEQETPVVERGLNMLE